MLEKEHGEIQWNTIEGPKYVHAGTFTDLMRQRELGLGEALIPMNYALTTRNSHFKKKVNCEFL